MRVKPFVFLALAFCLTAPEVFAQTILGTYATGSAGFDAGTEAVAVDPTDTYVYVANKIEGSLQVFDANLARAGTPGALLATVLDTGRSEGLALSPGGEVIYIPNNNPGPNNNTLQVRLAYGVNKAMAVVVDLALFSPNEDDGQDSGDDVAVSGDGRWIAVGRSMDGAYDLIEVTGSPMEAGSYGLPRPTIFTYRPGDDEGQPLILDEVVFSADGTKLYASLILQLRVEEVAVADGASLRQFPVDDGPAGLALSGDGKQLFATEIWGAGTSRIDLADGSVASFGGPEGGPFDVAADPRAAGKLVYSVHEFTDSLQINDATGAEPTRTLSLPGGSHTAVAVSPDGKTVWVVAHNDRSGPGALICVDVADLLDDTPPTAPLAKATGWILYE